MSIELLNVDHLFNIQKEIVDNKLCNERLSSYYRCLLNNSLIRHQQQLSINPQSRSSSIKNKNELESLSSGLCMYCWSSINKFRLIPKKLKHKKKNRMKKGKNFDYNIIKFKCKNCETNFRLKALCQSQKQKINNNNNLKIDKNKISKTKILINNQQQSTNNHKEILQKLLANSKKNRNLDEKTKLSSFLQNCFD